MEIFFESFAIGINDTIPIITKTRAQAQQKNIQLYAKSKTDIFELTGNVRRMRK